MSTFITRKQVRQLFGTLPLPVRMETFQSDSRLVPELISQYLMVAIAQGAAFKDDQGNYWMSDEVMAEGIEIAEQRIAELQAYQQYLQTQRDALAAHTPLINSPHGQ